MWEEEHPLAGFRNGNESILFVQFLILGIGSAWAFATEHTMALTMLTAVGTLSLILYFNHVQQNLFEHARAARRFWLLLLPVGYAIAVFIAGQFNPVLESVEVGTVTFKALLEQPVTLPVSTLPALGWPSLAFHSGLFIAIVGLIALPKGAHLFWQLLWVLALSACVLAALGWISLLLGATRIYLFMEPPQEEFFSSFTHPRYWSSFALVWSVVLGGLMLQKKSRRDWADFFADKGLLLIIAFALLLGSAFFTGSPLQQMFCGLVLAGFLLVIAIEQWQKSARFNSLLLWVMAAAAFAAAIGVLLHSMFGSGTTTPTGISLVTQKQLWDDAWELFLARPLFGWGEGGFAAMHPFIQSTELEEARYTNPASDLLLTLVNRGILGTLVAWAVPTGVVIAFLRLKNRKDLSYCLLLGAAVLGLLSLVSATLQSPPVLLTFYLLIVSAYQWSRLNMPMQTPVSRNLIAPEPRLAVTANSRRSRSEDEPQLQSVRHKDSSTVALKAKNTSPSVSVVTNRDSATNEAAADNPATPADAEAAFNAIEADARFDFIVIGGGSAGYAAANLVQRAGKSVAIVDSASELGGLCILRGCMPSKTLIYSAEILHLAQQGKSFGLAIPSAKVDMAALHERKKRVIAEFAQYRQEQLESGRFTLYRQAAAFNGRQCLQLADGTKLAGRKILIATGSAVNVPPVPGLRETPFWTSDDILDLDFVPESVVVLGGGIVACELAQFLHRIGTKVTLIQRSARLLKEQSAEAAAVIEKAFIAEGIEVITGTSLEHIGQEPQGGVRVTFTKDGATHSRTAKHLFNALGRKPNTASLNLEAAGITTRQSGHIAANAMQQTANPDVYAAGDVAGPHEIVHVAILQAEVAARHALGQQTAPVDLAALTGVVFTDPQIARVGPTDEELHKRGIATVSASYPFDDHGKSILMEAKRGYVKTVVNKADGRLLAAECVGKDASELIHALAVAVSLRARATDLLGVHWYHPTLSEIWTYPLEDCVDALARESSEPPSQG